MTAPKFVLASLLLVLPAVAQDPVPAGRPAQGHPVPVILDLSFAGGTLADLVGRIRAKEGRANIVLAEQAAEAIVPAIDLRGAGLDQSLEAVCAVAASKHRIRVQEFRGAGESVYSIVAQPQPHPQPGSAPLGPVETEGTEVQSLRRLTEAGPAGGGVTAATALSAIEAAVGGPGRLAALLYHQDSGLMIARGTREQLAIAKSVLRSLEQGLPPRKPAEGAPAATQSGK